MNHLKFKFKLHECMKSLEPFKDQLTILQDLSGKCVRRGHISHYGALGCFKAGGEKDKGTPLMATIDGELGLHAPGVFPMFTPPPHWAQENS